MSKHIKPKKTLSIRTKFFLRSLFTNVQLLLIPILIIGPYSIFRSSVDNTKAIERSMMQTLDQCNSTMESFYSQIDNANIFFSSNPRVKLQLDKAFNEKSLSLSSLKNVENLSLYFQNLMFTNLYINEIYVYYDNEYQRMYKASASALQTVPYLEDSVLTQKLRQTDGTDFWCEVHSANMELSPSETPESLFFYQRLYSRSSHRPIGMLIFEFHLNKLAKYFESLIQYKNQVIYLLDRNHSLLYTNSSAPDPKQDLTALLSALDSSETKQTFFNITLHDVPCKSAFLQSARNNGLMYFTYAPSNEIYLSTKNLSGTYVVLMICAIGLSVILAVYKSSREYRYISSILDIFSNPAASQHLFEQMPQSTSNPFEYIIMNIIASFCEWRIKNARTEQKTQRVTSPVFSFSKITALFRWQSPYARAFL